MENDLDAAQRVEPLEQVIDDLKEILRARHIARLQRGECGVSQGFVWSDILTNVERISDHCSNIAATVFDVSEGDLSLHESLRKTKASDSHYKELYKAYSEKYAV